MSLESSGSADSHVIRYRPDIDGLRAVAVLSVVAFHLWRTAVRGGYLGVDMFFVLSGYLITSIIWREAREEFFSIVRFYDRRVRRIMPALLAVLAVTTLASVALLLPADLIGFARSLLATLIFGANVYFWRDTNYFARAAEDKPLLHLWSLGVEEQFYILFPLLLAGLARWRSNMVVPVLGGLTAASLAANMLTLYVGGDSPAFFLLPTRAWELGIGGLLAVLPASTAPRSTAATLTGLFGAALVVESIAFPLHAIRFLPVALPAVAGTGLIVFAGQAEPSAVNRVLQWAPLVFVGLISYSLYLWHWPVIVLGRYYLVRDFGPIETLAAIALMLGVAAGSWRFVERPFRSRSIRIGPLRWMAASFSALLGAAAVLLLHLGGLPGRLNAEAARIDEAVGTNYRCAVSDMVTFGAARACRMNLPSGDVADADVVLLGNSHAQMYAPAWQSILAEGGQRGLLIPVNGCLPTVTANTSGACSEVAGRNLAQIGALRRARTVIIGLNWWHGADALVGPNGRPVDNRNDMALVSALDNLIASLRRSGKRVILIGPIAEPGWDIASLRSRQLAFDRPLRGPQFLPVTQFRARFGAAILHFASRRDIAFVRADTIQCGATRCEYLLDGRSLFADSDHIAAAELPRFRGLFAAALEAAPPAAP